MAKEEKVVEEIVEEITPQAQGTEKGDLVPEVTVKEDGTHKIDFDKLVTKPEKGKVAEEVKEEVKVEEPVAVIEEEVAPKEPTVLEEITEEAEKSVKESEIGKVKPTETNLVNNINKSSLTKSSKIFSLEYTGVLTQKTLFGINFVTNWVFFADSQGSCVGI